MRRVAFWQLFIKKGATLHKKSGPDNSDPDFFSLRFPSLDCQASDE